MGRLSSDELEHFEREGFLIVRGGVETSLLADVFRGTTRILSEYTGLDASGISSWKDPELHSRLIALRENDRDRFGSIYCATSQIVALRALYASEPLCALASELLGDPPETLCLRDPGLRMDTPGDTRAVYDWHQDSTYSDINRSGRNGFVAWIPMQRVDASNGAIIVCPGSQREGRLDVVPERPDAHSAEQRRVDPVIVRRYEQLTVEADPGDVAFLHGDVIHRSGHNSSSSIRFTGIGRFHRTLADDFYYRLGDREVTSKDGVEVHA